jgi:hypothetical protein
VDEVDGPLFHAFASGLRKAAELRSAGQPRAAVPTREVKYPAALPRVVTAERVVRIVLGLHGGQGAVNEVDGDCAFSDGGGNTLHVAGANVAHGEYAGKAGFQHEGFAIDLPG